MDEFDCETLYLDLYDIVADYAEYAQSDSRVRNFLPETIIATLTAAGVSAFVTAFSQTFGNVVSSATIERMKRLLHIAKSGDQNIDPKKQIEATVESLNILGLYLPLLNGSTEYQRAQEERWVAQELTERGFPLHIANIVAGDMVRRLRQASEKGKGR